MTMRLGVTRTLFLQWKLVREGLEHFSPAAYHVSAILTPVKGRPLIVGTMGEGVFSLGENGWKSLSEGLPQKIRVRDISANPHNPDHILLATELNGVWESKDGGAGWGQIVKGKSI